MVLIEPSRDGLIEPGRFEQHIAALQPPGLRADAPSATQRFDSTSTRPPNTRLVVIDPISAYTGKVDSNNNTEVRGLLAPLAELAGRPERHINISRT
jgi:hypothetical protein